MLNGVYIIVQANDLKTKILVLILCDTSIIVSDTVHHLLKQLICVNILKIFIIYETIIYT